MFQTIRRRLKLLLLRVEKFNPVEQFGILDIKEEATIIVTWD